MRQDSMWVSSIWCSHCIPARGDHPQEVKYCSVATSHSPAHRVNCGWAAGQCYLSLRPDHRDSALSWLRRRRAGICLRNELNSYRRVFWRWSDWSHPAGAATDGFVTGWRLQLPVLWHRTWNRALWERGRWKRMLTSRGAIISVQRHYYVKYWGQTSRSPGSLLIISPFCLSELCRHQAIQRGITSQQKTASQPASNRMSSTTHAFFFNYK